jgi:chromate transporter
VWIFEGHELPPQFLWTSRKQHLMRTARKNSAPTIGTLLRIWTGIGLQSFGGGASTQLLIRREFVEKRPWVGADELGHFWNLCLFTPGINLIALTILIGRKLGGPWGIVVSLAGLLLPSAAVTCALTAGFEVVQHSTVIHAILRGVVPATAGVMGVVAYGFAQPIMRRARGEGVRSVSVSGAIMLGAALALILIKLPVAVVLVGVALLGVIIFTPWRAPTPAPAPTPVTVGSRDEERPS